MLKFSKGDAVTVNDTSAATHMRGARGVVLFHCDLLAEETYEVRFPQGRFECRATELDKSAPHPVHSFMGVPEARKVMRLLGQSTPAALGELQRMGIAMGLCTMQTDAETTCRRMKRAAENAIRLFAP